MRYTVTEESVGITVKDFLYKKLGFSTASVKRVKYREDGIKLNGERVNVRRVLYLGDILEIAFEDKKEDENIYTVPVDIPITVVYEDKCVTVVDKPPMMPAHPSLGHKDDTVANALAYRYSSAPFVFRPVNRLDRDTSGLMLIARDRVSAGKLYLSQKRGHIHKSYIAVLEGVMPYVSGRICVYMSREGDSIVKRRVCGEDDDGAKLAVTEYETIAVKNGVSVVKAVPVTGRTHQLRVTFAHMGCPIVGDTMYGRACEYITRQALHAANLSFPHPENEKTVYLSAELPEDMARLIEAFGFSVSDVIIK